MGGFQVMGVVGEQHQRRKSGGTNGIALGDGLGGITDRVERIGDVTHLLGQARHLGDATGVVSDGAVGVQRHNHARHGQHGGRGDGDAIQSREREGGPDGDAHREHR